VVCRASQQNTTPNNYSGNPQKYYLRYKGNYKKSLSWGLIAEKDAGEEFFTNTNIYGFDFYSANIQYHGSKTLKNIAIGDFRVRKGQGLLIWQGFSSGKSTQITSIQKRGQGITGNSSVDEYNFFRGGSITLNYKCFDFSTFISYKKIDAKINSISNEIETIRVDGLHRTPTELQYEKNSIEKAFGSSINYQGKNLSIGINWLNIAYDQPIQPSNEAYKKFGFSEKIYSGFSTDYKILLQQFQFYGEMAYADSSIAGITGINFMPHPSFIASVLYRYYQPSYFSPYANAMSEGTLTSNEEGLFTGFKWISNWNITLSAFADIFSFPWVKYGINGPSTGKEYLLEGLYTLSNNFNISVRYKNQEKDKNFNTSENVAIKELLPFRNQSLRTHIWYRISKQLSMSTRYEWSLSGYTNKTFSPGNLIYQDIIYAPTTKIQFNFRYAWFDIRDYNSRIYAYESNVRYAYSMPAYYDTGTKTNLVVHYKPFSKVSIWARLSKTSFFNTELEDKFDASLQLILKL
jgi:hypothetical protein